MENEKINIRNMYIELLNKLKGVEGVDIHYIDQMVQLLEHDIDLIEMPVNWILSVIPSGTTTEDPLVKSSQVPAAQVNSDWNATSGVAQILNKPTIPAAQVNSDWNATSGVAQILNKPRLAQAHNKVIVAQDWHLENSEYVVNTTIPGNASFVMMAMNTNYLLPTSYSDYNRITRFTYEGAGAYTTNIKLFANSVPQDEVDLTFIALY